MSDNEADDTTNEARLSRNFSFDVARKREGIELSVATDVMIVLQSAWDPM